MVITTNFIAIAVLAVLLVMLAAVFYQLAIRWFDMYTDRPYENQFHEDALYQAPIEPVNDPNYIQHQTNVQQVKSSKHSNTNNTSNNPETSWTLLD